MWWRNFCNFPWWLENVKSRSKIVLVSNKHHFEICFPKKRIKFFWSKLSKLHKKDPILHVATTFSLKHLETRTSHGPIPHPLSQFPSIFDCFSPQDTNFVPNLALYPPKLIWVPFPSSFGFIPRTIKRKIEWISLLAAVEWTYTCTYVNHKQVEFSRVPNRFCNGIKQYLQLCWNQRKLIPPAAIRHFQIDLLMQYQ